MKMLKISRNFQLRGFTTAVAKSLFSFIPGSSFQPSSPRVKVSTELRNFCSLLYPPNTTMTSCIMTAEWPHLLWFSEGNLSLRPVSVSYMMTSFKTWSFLSAPPITMIMLPQVTVDIPQTGLGKDGHGLNFFVVKS